MMTERDRLFQEQLDQAVRLVRSSQHPLLVCHVAPDGDAVGSLMGLGLALRHRGLEPVLACSDSIPADLYFIPGAEDIVQNIDGSFDLVISLDSSDTARMGHIAQSPAVESVPLLNIDHHLTNLNFGDINLVDDTASSTAEVVLRLLERMAVPIDVEIATALLTGIVGDTRGFRTNNVTAQVMEIAVRLMEAGASLSDIARQALDRRPTAAVRLWGAALAQLQVEGRVIWTSIPLAIRQAVGYQDSGDAGLVNFLLSADDADVAAVFVERDGGEVEVGLRATPGFDVAQAALQFGGGGHALAAGCTIPGPLAEAQPRFLAALQTDLERQRQA